MSKPNLLVFSSPEATAIDKSFREVGLFGWGQNPILDKLQSAPGRLRRHRIIDQELQTARGSEKRDLLRQRQELQCESTGVDLTPPSPSPAPSPAAPKKSISW
jgi:hypothetical protein